MQVIRGKVNPTKDFPCMLGLRRRPGGQHVHSKEGSEKRRAQTNVGIGAFWGYRA